MLVVSPMEAYQNRRLQRSILRQLEDAAPTELEPMPGCNVALGDARALIPDFTVIDQPGFEGVILDARHHVLVGEIASPSTRLYDRTAKRALYAESGIPFLMLVDPGHPPEAVLFELHDGAYSEIARSVGGRLAMSRPFPMILDLIDPRRQPGA
jgi:Uma2 family endonuclease